MRRFLVLPFLLAGIVWACGFDATLREYLRISFWRPFVKTPESFRPAGLKRLVEPFAGMGPTVGAGALGRLRRHYRLREYDAIPPLVAGVRADARLTPMEREEVELLELKCAMWREDPAAKARMKEFARKSKFPVYASEARGWLARMHYRDGEQSAAGKIYLAELKRPDTNLSESVLTDSLRIVYGFNGRDTLIAQLEDYFDTSEHAEFAVQMVTNVSRRQPADAPPPSIPYERIQQLMEKSRPVLRSPAVVNLGMRLALQAGNPQGALRIASRAPPAMDDPDFLWMLGASRFLVKDYAGAAAPLTKLANSRKANGYQRAGARYGLCGVYMKLGDRVRQLHWALSISDPLPWSPAEDETGVYFSWSGFDFGLLLDAEASIEDLEKLLAEYPGSEKIALVRYSLAVRLARRERYEEAGAMFASIGAKLRANRIGQLAALARDASPEGRFAMAKYLDENQERLFFNDRLWNGLQTYALMGESDARLTRQERVTLLAAERQLRDEQEERWRAYQIYHQLVREQGNTPLGRRAAERAISCLRRISARFGRAAEVRAADIELTRWLRTARIV
ncbi:MAG: hypothetical protein FJW30_20900 [Acidobacteria bacterium]|nr:hypothetical protein [Acidobacteriota bacterium]